MSETENQQSGMSSFLTPVAQKQPPITLARDSRGGEAFLSQERTSNKVHKNKAPKRALIFLSTRERKLKEPILSMVRVLNQMQMTKTSPALHDGFHLHFFSTEQIFTLNSLPRLFPVFQLFFNLLFIPSAFKNACHHLLLQIFQLKQDFF